VSTEYAEAMAEHVAQLAADAVVSSSGGGGGSEGGADAASVAGPAPPAPESLTKEPLAIVAPPAAELRAADVEALQVRWGVS